MGIGQIYNSAVNVGLAATQKGSGSGSNLKNFLGTIDKYGLQIASNFTVVYSGFVGLQFMIQDISIPGLKSNTGSIYYKGRLINVPVNYDHEHDISMTVLYDGSGYVYNMLRNIMMNDFNNRKVHNRYTLTVTMHGDGQNSGGSVVKMEGIRFTNIGGINLGQTNNNIMTFNLQGTVDTIDFQYTNVKSKDGLLGKIDKASSSLTKMLGS